MGTGSSLPYKGLRAHLDIDNPPGRGYKFRHEPFTAAAVTIGHVRPSQPAAIDTGN